VIGNIYASAGRFDEAARQYGKALQIDANFAEAHNNLGSAYVMKGRLAEAMQEYQEALRIEPDNIRFLANMKLARAKAAIK